MLMNHLLALAKELVSRLVSSLAISQHASAHPHSRNASRDLLASNESRDLPGCARACCDIELHMRSYATVRHSYATVRHS